MFISDTFLDWFLSNERIKNRKGKWFLAVGSLKENLNASEVIKNDQACLKSKLLRDALSWTFPISSYFLHVYSGGAYYFNENIDQWTGAGITVSTYSSVPNRRPVLNKRPGGKFTQI